MMKTQVIFFTLLIGISCKSQEVISPNSKDIKIKSLTKEMPRSGYDFFEISNTSDSNYLINKLGFKNIKSTVFENGEEYAPYTFINSHPTQWGIDECKSIYCLFLSILMLKRTYFLILHLIVFISLMIRISIVFLMSQSTQLELHIVMDVSNM